MSVTKAKRRACRPSRVVSVTRADLTAFERRLLAKIAPVPAPIQPFTWAADPLDKLKLRALSLAPGTAVQGGIYAGITTIDLKPAMLIVGPEHDGKLNWNDAVEHAKTVKVDGCQDYVLGSRVDGALAFATVRKLFQPEWYWLGEQHASRSRYAWLQNFCHGIQNVWSKGTLLRVRVFRRVLLDHLTIQSFGPAQETE